MMSQQVRETDNHRADLTLATRLQQNIQQKELHWVAYMRHQYFHIRGDLSLHPIQKQIQNLRFVIMLLFRRGKRRNKYTTGRKSK